MFDAFRRRGRLLCCLASLLLPLPLRAEPLDYMLDSDRSWVQFELLHFGTSTIRGRLGPVRGVVSLDRERGRGEISVELDTASVSTGLPVFDARIRGPDLLDAEAHPRAWFVARELRFDERGGLRAARGELTLRGVSLALELAAERFGCRDQADGRQRCGGDFVGRLKRSEAGIVFGLPFVGDEVVLRIQAEGLR